MNLASIIGLVVLLSAADLLKAACMIVSIQYHFVADNSTDFPIMQLIFGEQCRPAVVVSAIATDVIGVATIAAIKKTVNTRLTIALCSSFDLFLS